MSVQIVGYRVEYEYGYGGWTGETTDIDEIVATFDNEKDARQYIEDSKLKNPKNKMRPFKTESLLNIFQYAIIEENRYCDSPPHNPKIRKRRK